MVTPEPESAFRGFTKPIAAPLETLEQAVEKTEDAFGQNGSGG